MVDMIAIIWRHDNLLGIMEPRQCLHRPRLMLFRVLAAPETCLTTAVSGHGKIYSEELLVSAGAEPVLTQVIVNLGAASRQFCTPCPFSSRQDVAQVRGMVKAHQTSSFPATCLWFGLFSGGY